MPGDHVVCCDKDGQLTINGVSITEPYIKPGDTPGGGKASFDITVPPDKVWVMGDHRSDSSDSRFHDDGTGATWVGPHRGHHRSRRDDRLAHRPREVALGARTCSLLRPTRLGPAGPHTRVHGRHRLSGRLPLHEALATRRARVAAGRASCARRHGRGRSGALAGPVSVGVVIIDETCRSAPVGVKDSKLLTPLARGRMVRPIQRWARAYAVGHSSPAEIDEVGIMGGLRLAGMRALASVRRPEFPTW